MSAPRTVTPHELRNLLHGGRELALLDVREPGEFGGSHLLFATPLPYSRLDLEIGALAPRRNVPVVLCDDGASGVAQRAAARLANIGYTDVAVLEGGTRGWAAAGYSLFAGVNVPSKLFGELVEHAYRTPRVTVTELAAMKDRGEDFVIVDGRPFSEYRKMNIPGGICCPNAELPYRIREIVGNPHTKIVVNCAGRTRSILGAQTLINFGVPNPVYALENGTQGWVLADFELERGASRRYPERVDPATLPELRARAETLMRRHGVRTVAAEEVRAWIADPQRTTYLLDVRTPEEFARGTLPGAVHAPGGQLVQATDQWVGVRNARIVLVDGEGVRAPVAASWLAQLGCDAYVLENGIDADVSMPARPAPALPALRAMSVDEVARCIEDSRCTVLDLRPSMTFRQGHIPGSRWSIRPRIVEAARGTQELIVLLADDPRLAQAAAIDLRENGARDIALLDGGFDAWVQAGRAIEAAPQVPPDRECIDYLFFVHDRHAGNREAMRQYLAWETGLVAQLDAEERKLFRVGAG